MAKDKASKETKKEAAQSVHRTIHSRLPLELLPACQSIARHCRDAMNSATWLARTALRCFERPAGSKDWALKPEDKRPPNWKEALEAFPAPIKQGRSSSAPPIAHEGARWSPRSPRLAPRGKMTKPREIARRLPRSPA